MRVDRVLFALLLAAASGAAEKLDPAKWSLEFQPAMAAPGSKILARLQAKIEPGWHLYSLNPPAGGPIRTTVRLSDTTTVTSFHVLEPQPKRAFDPNFNLDTETYEDAPVF